MGVNIPGLPTLTLFIFVGMATILVTLILFCCIWANLMRSRQQLVIENAIRAGTWIPKERAVDLSKRPMMYEAYLDSPLRGVECPNIFEKDHRGNLIMPLSICPTEEDSPFDPTVLLIRQPSPFTVVLNKLRKSSKPSSHQASSSSPPETINVNVIIAMPSKTPFSVIKPSSTTSLEPELPHVAIGTLEIPYSLNGEAPG